MATFNGLHHAITIVGHQTTNLFRWTQDFSDSELVFTWLIERPLSEPISWIMPVVAISILVAAPASIYYLVNKDSEIILMIVRCIIWAHLSLFHSQTFCSKFSQ